MDSSEFSDCESSSVQLGLNVSEDVQPTVKEQVEVQIDNLVNTYTCFEEHSSINHIVALTKFVTVFLRFSLQSPPNLHFLIKKSFSCV